MLGGLGFGAKGWIYAEHRAQSRDPDCLGHVADNVSDTRVQECPITVGPAMGDAAQRALSAPRRGGALIGSLGELSRWNGGRGNWMLSASECRRGKPSGVDQTTIMPRTKPAASINQP